MAKTSHSLEVVRLADIARALGWKPQAVSIPLQRRSEVEVGEAFERRRRTREGDR